MEQGNPMKLERSQIMRRLALLMPACAFLGGCMSSSPIWDAHFGEAVRTVTQSQIIDPQAGEHAPSAPGIDGQSAVSAMTQYDKSFSQPPTSSNPYVIGVGTGTGTGSQ
jgi:hypothetical protein